jgi:hypothetical protein
LGGTLRQIHFFFAGVEIGPFSEEQVRRYFQEGYLYPSDLAKEDGAKEWSPLQTIMTGLTPPQPTLPLVPSLAVASVPSGLKPLPPAEVRKGVSFTSTVPKIFGKISRNVSPKSI